MHTHLLAHDASQRVRARTCTMALRSLHKTMLAGEIAGEDCALLLEERRLKKTLEVSLFHEEPDLVLSVVRAARDKLHDTVREGAVDR